MEIPRNDNNVHAEQVESAIKFVLDKFSSGADYVQLPWTEFKYSVAKDVACKFLSRGYHACEIEHMRGNGPCWFWYGIKISKSPIDPDRGQFSKSSWEILG